MLTQEQAEQRGLIVNAIKALTDALNNKMDQAARAGLDVRISVPVIVYSKEVCNKQHVEVRVFQEVS